MRALACVLVLWAGPALAQGRLSPVAPYACDATREGDSYGNTTDHKAYYCNGTAWTSTVDGVLEPTRYVELMADYLGCATTTCQLEPWFANSTGTNASCQVPNGNLLGNQDFGLLQCDTGTTATGRGMAVGSTDMFSLGAGQVIFATRAYLDDISDDTDDYTFMAGLSDTVAGTDGTDAAGFRYNDDTNGGKWEGFTRSNTSETPCDTTVAVAADTWYTLKLVVNAAGSNVDFYVNGTLRCSIVATIPTGTTRALGIVPIRILKTLGNTQRNAYLDYTYVQVILTSAR